jgi:hypothetical protein
MIPPPKGGPSSDREGSLGVCVFCGGVRLELKCLSACVRAFVEKDLFFFLRGVMEVKTSRGNEFLCSKEGEKLRKERVRGGESKHGAKRKKRAMHLASEATPFFVTETAEGGGLGWGGKRGENSAQNTARQQ